MNLIRAGGLTRRIYIAFLAAAVLPTAIAGSIGVWLSLDRLRTATLLGLQQEVSARSGGLRLFFDTVASELRFLATDPRAVALLSGSGGHGSLESTRTAQSIGDAYARLARARPDIYQVRLLDAKGMECVRVDKRPEGVSVLPAGELQDKSDRYYVREALANAPGKVYVSPLDLNVERGQAEKPERPVVRLAATVTGPSGAVIGAVIVNLHAQVLIEPVQQMVQAREGTAYLFDRSAQFLARGREELRGGFLMQPAAKLTTVSPTVLEKLMGGTAGSLLAEGSIWAHAPVEFSVDDLSAQAPQWVIAIAFPEKALLRQVVDLAKLYAVLLTALLIAAAAGYSISRRLIGPLKELAKEADAIATGDLGRRVRVEGRDEIARLGERFNLMAARLQATLAQLQQHRERLEAEIANRTMDLMAERARLAAVLRHTSDAIAAFRADGELLFANRAAQRLLGNPMVVDPDAVSQMQNLLMGDGHPGREEIAVRRRTLSISRDILPSDSGTGDLVVVARDVTEDRRLADEKREFDRQVFQVDKLATLGELAMGLAHEVGNPLAGMKAVVQALLLECDLPLAVAEDLRRLESEVDRLAHFLERFHGMAVPHPLQLSAQALAPAVEEMLFWIRKPARSSGVVLKADVGTDLAPLSADAAQLRQVLLNLFVNALQAMPNGGQLSVRAAQQAGELLIEVQDTGSGIAPELQAQIFKPFFTTRSGGSGLGLAVCAQVVRDHGGRIEVRSRPGDTLFLVHWPIHAVPIEPFPTSP